MLETGARRDGARLDIKHSPVSHGSRTTRTHIMVLQRGVFTLDGHAAMSVIYWVTGLELE